jgi:proteasome lid subunit RPN8/RPN11
MDPDAFNGLTLSEPVHAALCAAARDAAPLEACGLLAGRDGHASWFRRLRNADESAEHYRMAPEEQFAAVRALRAEGLRLLAIWHSHPATPARMSAEDLRLAFTPDVIYVIVSLADPSGPRVKGFRVTDGVPEETPIRIGGAPPPGDHP